MKILAPGREQTGWAGEFTCTGKGNGGGGCGAKLLVEQPDLYTTHSSHYDGSKETYVTFCCPCCGIETDIEKFSAHLPIPTKAEWNRMRRGEDKASLGLSALTDGHGDEP